MTVTHDTCDSHAPLEKKFRDVATRFFATRIHAKRVCEVNMFGESQARAWGRRSALGSGWTQNAHQQTHWEHHLASDLPLRMLETLMEPRAEESESSSSPLADLSLQ